MQYQTQQILCKRNQAKASALLSHRKSVKESRRDVHPSWQQGSLVLLHWLPGEQVHGHQHQRLHRQVARPLLLPPSTLATCPKVSCWSWRLGVLSWSRWTAGTTSTSSPVLSSFYPTPGCWPSPKAALW